MADASSCARCGSDSADPRQFIRHGSAIDEAYCNSCWPIVSEELSGSSSEIDPEKMKWIHEVMEGEEGPHPGDDIFDAFKPPRVFINVREYPPENWNRKGDEELGLATRHGTHDDIAWDELMDDFAERGGEGPNLDDRLDGPDRIPGFHPTNTFIPLEVQRINQFILAARERNKRLMLSVTRTSTSGHPKIPSTMHGTW